MEPFLINCPKCSGTEFWQTADKRLKCKKCRHLFTPRQNPFNISNETLEKIVSEFILEHPTKIISERVNISKYKLLKVLTTLRELMTNNIKLPKEPIPIKLPIIGIVFREGQFFAEVVPGIADVEVRKLKSSFKKGLPLPEKLQRYVGLIFKGNLYRLSKDKENEKRHHIDALEGFWGYLKRKLLIKGGIRKEKLPLYLGEYSWRYNHRKLSLKEREKLLLNLLFRHFGAEGRLS